MPRPDLDLLTRDQITQQVDRFISSPEHRPSARSTLLHQLTLRDRYGKSPVSLKAGLVGPNSPNFAMPWVTLVVGLSVLSSIIAGNNLGACAAASVLLFGAILLIAVLGLARTQRYRSDSARTRNGQCAACAFDLSGLEEPIAPSQLATRRLGPSRCPECGLIWPLLAGLRHE